MDFEFSEDISPDLIALFEQTVLGTNGAKYKHLDVAESVQHTDHPLSFSLRRRGQLIANITFCKRDFGLYLRYFAFDKRFQSNGKARSNPKSSIKVAIEKVFQEITTAHPGTQNYCYAYIDAKNVRSKWMSETFGFQTKAKLATQSFSRFFPKKSTLLSFEKIGPESRALIEENYRHYTGYFDYFLKTCEVAVLRNEQGQILALGSFHQVRWEIQRLPGKFGSIQVKLLPYLPFLNKLIQPKAHTFLVPEAICNPSGKPTDIERLFEAVLAEKKCHSLLWWNDLRDPLYQKAQRHFNWGFLHRLIGVAEVDVVFRGDFEPKEPVFIAAFDMV
ncbi:MAG: hypothetical protein RLZZ301_17 [Bacteroidota bacterium]|jgi:hypothetical protein